MLKINLNKLTEDLFKLYTKNDVDLVWTKNKMNSILREYFFEEFTIEDFARCKTSAVCGDCYLVDYIADNDDTNIAEYTFGLILGENKEARKMLRKCIRQNKSYHETIEIVLGTCFRKTIERNFDILTK